MRQRDWDNMITEIVVVHNKELVPEDTVELCRRSSRTPVKEYVINEFLLRKVVNGFHYRLGVLSSCHNPCCCVLQVKGSTVLDLAVPTVLQ